MRNFDRFLKRSPDGKTMLNLGCGKTFHQDWVNIDFVPSSPEVICFDLTKEIPFASEVFDVVYHSHVLEHFTSRQGNFFVGECYRVLKPGGILRIAVPDLEVIARNYISFLEQCLLHSPGAHEKYEWTKLELFDQMTRNSSGGNYANFMSNFSDTQRQFAITRLGKEIDAIQNIEQATFYNRLRVHTMKTLGQKLGTRIIKLLLSIIGGKRSVEAFEVGLFRLSGEIHQCMYDRYSLSSLLQAQNFVEVKVMKANQSDIPQFNTFNLDMYQGEIRKPDSLFMEGRK